MAAAGVTSGSMLLMVIDVTFLVTAVATFANMARHRHGPQHPTDHTRCLHPGVGRACRYACAEGLDESAHPLPALARLGSR